MEISQIMHRNFEYGPIARGIYTVMLWCVWIFVFTAPIYLVYYIPLLIFLGIGLKPFLIQTGLASLYRAIDAKRTDQYNEKLRRNYHNVNAEKIKKRNKHLKEMKKKLTSKN